MKKLSLIVALCLSACSGAGEVAEQDLVGVYVADYGNEKATLTVNADHNYMHAIQLKNGEALNSQATWTSTRLASNPKYLIVEFSGFRTVPSYKDAQKEGWATEPEKTLLGRIRLCFDSDVGYCYVKQ